MVSVSSPREANILNVLTRHSEYKRFTRFLYDLCHYSKVSDTRMISIVKTNQIDDYEIERLYNTIKGEMKNEIK